MLPSARHFRLKAAQQELIGACGGIVRAAELCGYSKSHVGRWNNEDSPEWMPLDAADKLEQAVGKNLFTAAWLECRGLKLADPESREAKVACLTTEFAGLVTDFGAVLAEWAQAAADGHATPAEATRMRRQLPAIKERIAGLEQILAAVHAEGGLSVVGGKVTS